MVHHPKPNPVNDTLVWKLRLSTILINYIALLSKETWRNFGKNGFGICNFRTLAIEIASLLSKCSY